jgi:hypothetical protein
MGIATFKSKYRPANHAPSPPGIKSNCRAEGGFCLILIVIAISFMRFEARSE